MRRLSRGQLTLVIAVAVLLVGVVGTGAFVALATRPPVPPPTARVTPSPSPSAVALFVPSPGPTAAVCVDVGAWPLDRALEQLLIVSGTFADLGASAPEARAGVGAFVLFGQPPAGAGPAIRQGLAQLRAAAAASGHVIPWMSTDEEGGDIQRLSNVAGPLPSPRQMALRWTPQQLRAAVAAHAATLRALGIDMDLAPVVDVASASDQVADEADRSFSDDPSTVAADGVAYVAGLESGGVTAVVKHFPGLGHADANTDVAASTDPPLSSLERDDLLPFAAAITAGAPAVMVSHVRVPGLSGLRPASLAPETYRLLRDQLHFGGVAMTDALDARAIALAGYTEPGAAVAAIEAGADLAMIESRYWQPTLAALREALASGALLRATVQAAVGRVLTAKGVPVCAGASA